jgi:acyl-CoA-binding protein
MDLDTRFNQALEEVMKLPVRPSNDILLSLYALKKQATEGDCQAKKPGMFDFVGLAKYNAWLKLAGLTKDEAKSRYIEEVEKLLQQPG